MSAGNKQAAWLFAALMALTFSGWYYASAPAAVRLDEATLSTTADTIVHNLKVRQYDEGGQLINYLETPLLRHIPKDDKHWFKTPYILLNQEKQKPWEIRAQTATSFYGGKKILFNQNVTIHQSKDERSPESTLKTEEIIYYPKEKLATTQKEVVFEQPGSVILSTGMKAYLAEKRVQLLSKARGSYDPARG